VVTGARTSAARCPGLRGPLQLAMDRIGGPKEGLSLSGMRPVKPSIWKTTFFHTTHPVQVCIPPGLIHLPGKYYSSAPSAPRKLNAI